MKYLIPVLSIGAGSLLLSCGNGDSTIQSESASQSTQTQEESIVDNVSELVVETDKSSELTKVEETPTQEEVGMSENEIKQILSNYDPENEKFRLAELERRRNLALQADPTLRIPEPKQVIAQERAKYRKALEAQKKVKLNAVKKVTVETQPVTPKETKTQVETKTVTNLVAKVDPPIIKPEPTKPQPQLTISEPTKAELKPEQSKTEPIKADPTKPEQTKYVAVKSEPVKTELQKPEPTEAQPVKSEMTKPSPSPQTSEPVKKTVASTAGVAKINFDQMTFAFDTIVEGDIIDYQFKFVNTGTRTVEILNAKATCGCTRPSFPFLPIEPGQEGYIGVKYDSRTKSGNQTPEIDVITNFQDDPIKLFLKGFVKEKPKAEDSEK